MALLPKKSCRARDKNPLTPTQSSFFVFIDDIQKVLEQKKEPALVESIHRSYKAERTYLGDVGNESESDCPNKLHWRVTEQE